MVKHVNNIESFLMNVWNEVVEIIDEVLEENLCYFNFIYSLLNNNIDKDVVI